MYNSFLKLKSLQKLTYLEFKKIMFYLVWFLNYQKENVL